IVTGTCKVKARPETTPKQSNMKSVVRFFIQVMSPFTNRTQVRALREPEWRSRDALRIRVSAISLLFFLSDRSFHANRRIRRMRRRRFRRRIDSARSHLGAELAVVVVETFVLQGVAHRSEEHTSELQSR